MEQINGYWVKQILFSTEDIEATREKVADLKLNVGGANGLNRDLKQRERNKLQGFLAELAVFSFLRSKLGSLVYQRETDLSNQIDLFVGTKTIEIRSSLVSDINTALFGRRSNGDSVYHLVGAYTNSYKNKEKIKDYYIWVVFQKDLDLDHCWIVGGATKKQIEEAPEIEMVPKGKSCDNPTKYKALRPDQIYNIKDFLEVIRPNNNETLALAKKNKEDEFYTLYSTIEKETAHYSSYFKDKIVYLPCDDPSKSNFWKYFVEHYKDLGIKQLWSTYLDGCYTTYDGTEVKTYNLDSGDFRSEECLEYFRSADIIVTNPPFSLFRSFLVQSINCDCDVLILGNQNSSTTKDVFPLFRSNKIRYGYFCGSEQFVIPDEYETRSNNVKITEDGKRLITVEGIRWFTTFPVSKENRLEITKKMNPFVYRRYDNYPAFEVSKVADIPNFTGKLGVPISYLNYYDPNEFQLIGTSGELAGPVEIEGKVKKNPGRFYLRGKRLYDRIVIKKIDSNPQ